MTAKIAKAQPAAIDCSNCEACCCRLEVMLFTDTGVPARFIREVPGQVAVMRRGEDGWCAALDRNSLRCSIYEQRPLICREFAMGGEECLEERVEGLIARQPC
ncbi:YkgJ family cysteine cluster protein [Pseudaeromonas paramecii]|uniref:YkgJ family cysteine cluster protein n=1 Tax=Pseudaeromonas paramecii TaxID=2138166 RepID=A0ABP8QDV7_9GAMM